nr:hypothetical protein [uncultured Ruegeria sp.]
MSSRERASYGGAIRAIKNIHDHGWPWERSADDRYPNGQPPVNYGHLAAICYAQLEGWIEPQWQYNAAVPIGWKLTEAGHLALRRWREDEMPF